MEVLFAADGIYWGKFNSHKGHLQGLDFARYVRNSLNNAERFVVGVIEADGNLQTYSVEEYIEAFDKEDN